MSSEKARASARRRASTDVASTAGPAKGRPPARSISEGDRAGMCSLADGELDGVTWKESTGKHVHHVLTKKELKVQEIVHELLLSERVYLEGLRIIEEVFREPMLSRKLLDEPTAAKIFACSDQLLATNVRFCEKLAALVEEQKPIVSATDVAMLMIQGLGAWEQPYEEYCSQQNLGLARLRRAEVDHADVASFLQQCRSLPRCRQLGYEAYLLTPMQRLTRYLLFLRGLVSNCNELLDEPVLEAGVRSFEQLLDRINHEVRRTETAYQLECMKNNDDGVSPSYLAKEERRKRRESETRLKAPLLGVPSLKEMQLPQQGLERPGSACSGASSVLTQQSIAEELGSGRGAGSGGDKAERAARAIAAPGGNVSTKGGTATTATSAKGSKKAKKKKKGGCAVQ